jgi:hypothetical protein
MLRKTLAALTVVAVSCFATSAFADRYAAIAFSPSTNLFAYSYNYRDLSDAQNAALDACDDTTHGVLLTWATNGWCAVAVSDDGSWGAASGDTRAETESKALARCTGNATIRAWAYSGSD